MALILGCNRNSQLTIEVDVDNLIDELIDRGLTYKPENDDKLYICLDDLPEIKQDLLKFAIRFNPLNSSEWNICILAPQTISIFRHFAGQTKPNNSSSSSGK